MKLREIVVYSFLFLGAAFCFYYGAVTLVTEILPSERTDETLSAPTAPPVVFYSDEPTRDQLIETWFEALEKVETGGHKDPANAIGAAGERGWLQITRAYYIDSGYRALPYEVACRDRLACRQIVEGFMRRHVGHAWEDLDFELMSHLHNRGPAGAVYWKKVRKALNGS